MAVFTKLKAADAPAPRSAAANRLQARMQAYDRYLEDLASSEGMVGQLTPDAGETTTALSMRVRRSAKRNNMDVDTWAADGVLYFTVASAPANSAPAAPRKSTARRA